MSKPSKKIINGLLGLHFDHHLRVNLFANSKPSLSSAFRSYFPSNGSSNFTSSSSHFHSKLPSKPTYPNIGLTQIFSNFPKHQSLNSSLALVKPSHKFSSGFRFFSFKSSEIGQKLNGNFAKKVLQKPAAAVSSTFSKYREAIGLQIDAFCKRNYLFLLGAGGVMVCILLWRIMFGIANAFVGISEGLAKYGFLALSSAIVAFTVSSSPMHFTCLIEFLCIIYAVYSGIRN